MTMTKIQRLEFVLLTNSFWDEDRLPSFGIDPPVGAELQVEKGADGALWGVLLWTEGSSIRAERSARIYREAKSELRQTLERQLEELMYAAMPPAQTDMSRPDS